MSLRHPFPDVALPSFLRDFEPEFPPPVSKKPKEVKFRSGADIRAVCEAIAGYSNVKVTAAVGAGKSTLLPREIHAVTGLDVIHLVPSRLLAADLHLFLSEGEHSALYKKCTEVRAFGGFKGISIGYAAAAVALLMKKVGEAKEMVRIFGDKDVVLIHDESHESDAFTYIMAKLGSCIPGVKSVVSCSATHTADGSPMREPLGTFSTEMYPKENARVKDWDPADKGKPWSMNTFPGNVLIFVDSESEAESLVGKYNRAGATAYRVNAKMSEESYLHARKHLNDPNAGIVMFIADYSFRSGFTFDVSTIIDTCSVRYVEVVSGIASVRHRLAYSLERLQGTSRGARTVGSTCTAFYPNVKLDNAICLLEGVEVDAAAAIFRMLGFAVPAEIRHSLLSSGNLPMDFMACVNGAIPFACLPEGMLSPLVVNKSKRSSVETIEEVVGNYLDDSPTTPRVDFFASAIGPDVTHKAAISAKADEYLLQLRSLSGASSEIIPGTYYMCAGLPTEEVTSSLYGADWRTAYQDILKSPALTLGYTSVERMELVALLLAEYNRCVGTIAGIQSVLVNSDSLNSIMLKYPSLMNKWTENTSDTLRGAKNCMQALAVALNHLKDGRILYTPLDPDIELENEVGKMFAERLLAAVKQQNALLDTGKYLKYIQAKIQPAADIEVDEFDSLTIDTGQYTEKFRVKEKPVRIGSKAMQEVTVYAPNSVVWTSADYESAVSQYVKKAGISVNGISRLVFPGSGVEPVVVLQRMRDSGLYRRREPRTLEFTSGKQSYKYLK